MMVPLITAGELALLITAMGGALAVCGGGIAWLVNLVRTQLQEQAAAAEKAEQEAIARGRQLERMERLLEGPVYTRPPVWEGMAVPEVLLSGDHGAIARWRRDQAQERTALMRPELHDSSG